MSYHEALEDGIPMKKGADYSRNGYYPPCHICGQPVYTWAYRRGVKYTCSACRAEVIRQEREEKEDKAALVKEKKLEKAIKRVSAVTDIAAYDKAIKYIRDHLDRSGWFQSTEEIMVAMELIRRGVRGRHQVKVFEYSLDFVLDELKVVLEIDGSVFHGRDREKYQQTRDDVIRWKFGDGWEVIHIKTDCINMNVTRLMPAINEVLKKRKKCARQFT